MNMHLLSITLWDIIVFPEAGEKSMLVTTQVTLLIMSVQKLTF